MANDKSTEKLDLIHYKILAARYCMDIRDTVLPDLSVQDDTILAKLGADEQLNADQDNERLRLRQVEFCSRRSARMRSRSLVSTRT